MLLSFMDSSHTHAVISIDGRYPPALIDTLIADALTSPFFSGFIYVPAIHLFFWLLRLIAERIKLFDPSKLTGPCLYAIIHIAGFLLIVEAKAYKGKVPATETYGRG